MMSNLTFNLEVTRNNARLPEGNLDDLWVSGTSRWADERWVLDYEGDGYKPSTHTIIWSISLPDGSNLTDSKWKDLLETCRRLVWSLYVDPRDDGRFFSAKTIGTNLSDSLSKLLRWMVKCGYENFGQLDNEASWEYRDYVVENAVQKNPEGVARGMLLNSLKIFSLIYQQRDVFSECGAAPMVEQPYDGRTASDVASEAGTTVDSTISPLPDLVATTLLASAWRLLNQPAKDVIHLLDAYLGPDFSSSVPRRKSTSVVSKHIRDYQFSIIDGEERPWHEPLGMGLEISKTGRGTGMIRRPGVALRHLVSEIEAACLIVLQGSTGIRISELCGARAGVDEETGLPVCVKLRMSKTGLNELFYFESPERKFYKGKVMEWILGMRPCGSSYLPPAVISLSVLNRLFSQFRESAGMNFLIVDLKEKAGFPRNGSRIGPARAYQLLDMMRDFIRRSKCLSDLPDTIRSPSGILDISGYKEGRDFRSHQWRKTFAHYVFQMDPSMVPELAQHFKHMSHAMTEESYLGNDPETQQAIDSERTRLTVRFFFEQAGGNPAPLFGGMAETIDEYRSELKKVVGKGSESDRWKRMTQWVIEHDLRIWFSQWGKCFIGVNPGKARCHRVAGTDPWITTEPNVTGRSPSTCCGCGCFGISPEESGFWRRRYDSTAEFMEQKGARKLPGFRVALERNRQAKAILDIVERKAGSKKNGA